MIQEVVSLGVLAVFAFFYLKETPTWRTGLAFLLIIGAVLLIRGDGGSDEQPAQINESATLK